MKFGALLFVCGVVADAAQLGTPASVLSGPVANRKDDSIWEVIATEPSYSAFLDLIRMHKSVQEVLENEDNKVTLLMPVSTAVAGVKAVPARHVEALLKYHIVDAVVSADEIRKGAYSELPTMLSGGDAAGGLPKDASQIIAVREGRPAGARIGHTVKCKNGIIHVIDRFLSVPGETPDGVDGTPFSRMVANMRDNIKERKGLTFFVPTLKSFNVATQHKSDVRVTKRHVVEGLVYEGDWKNGSKYTAADGTVLQITLKGNRPYVNGRPIFRTNLITNFGVVHLIAGGISSLSPEQEIDAPDAPGKKLNVKAPTATSTATTTTTEPTKKEKGLGFYMKIVLPASVLVIVVAGLLVIVTRSRASKQ